MTKMFDFTYSEARTCGQEAYDASLVDDSWMSSQERQLYESAMHLIPVLQQREKDCITARSLPDETFADFQRLGLPRILQPMLYGGFEGSTTLLSRIVEDLSVACPSSGWVLAVYGEHAWMAASFAKQAQDEIWLENQQAVVASSLAPRATAEIVEGGYRVTGTYPFASGCKHALWLVLGVFVQNGESREMRYMLVPKHDVEILDDWETLGLRGTGSNTLLLDNVFIPDHRTVVDKSLQTGDTPGSKVHPDYALLRAPRQVFSTFTQLPVTLGLGRRVLNHVCQTMQGRVSRGTTNLQDSQIVQLKIGEAAADLNAAITVAHRRQQYTHERMKRGLELGQRDVFACRRDSVWANSMARQSIEKLISITSAEIVHNRNDLQSWYRDALTTGTHFSANWESAMVPYGKFQLGLI